MGRFRTFGFQHKIQNICLARDYNLWYYLWSIVQKKWNSRGAKLFCMGSNHGLYFLLQQKGQVRPLFILVCDQFFLDVQVKIFSHAPFRLVPNAAFVVAVKRVKAPVGGGALPVVVSEVPFPNHGGAV